MFDAFFLEVTHNSIIVWLFKIAIPRKCIDSHSDAFEILAALLEKARIQLGKSKVEPKYVLIAPRQYNKTVSWGVPERWSEFRGDVHVCYLDVTSLGCWVDDLLACLPGDAEPM